MLFNVNLHSSISFPETSNSNIATSRQLLFVLSNTALKSTNRWCHDPLVTCSKILRLVSCRFSRCKATVIRSNQFVDGGLYSFTQYVICDIKETYSTVGDADYGVFLSVAWAEHIFLLRRIFPQSIDHRRFVVFQAGNGYSNSFIVGYYNVYSIALDWGFGITIPGCRTFTAIQQSAFSKLQYGNPHRTSSSFFLSENQ